MSHGMHIFITTLYRRLYFVAVPGSVAVPHTLLTHVKYWCCVSAPVTKTLHGIYWRRGDSAEMIKWIWKCHIQGVIHIQTTVTGPLMFLCDCFLYKSLIGRVPVQQTTTASRVDVSIDYIWFPCGGSWNGLLCIQLPVNASDCWEET